MILTETIIHHISEELNIPVVSVREINMYKEGDFTHFNQCLDNYLVPRLWSYIIKNGDYHTRRTEVDNFNQNNRWKKRGLSVLPTKYGIAFTASFLNQASALVLVYRDGSVLLSHGGAEMGQGLHTKMIQICADAFNIPFEKVHLSETATDKVANASPTAASSSSDLNGMAVLDACNQIMKRLAPFRETNPTFSFEQVLLLQSFLNSCQVVNLAYLERVNLCANGFYQITDLNYDWKQNSGRLYNCIEIELLISKHDYVDFTFGVAITEVEVDLLTGDFQVLRSDIGMDLGKSINPAIDVGQIEGAFVQGMGMTTMEETLYFPTGSLLTKGYTDTNFN